MIKYPLEAVNRGFVRVLQANSASALLVIAATALSGCGGGGTGGVASSGVSPSEPLRDALAQVSVLTVNAGDPFVVSGNTTTSTYGLKSMGWTVVANGVAPAVAGLGLLNADCASADKQNRVGPYSTSSNWTCSTTGRAPTNIPKDVEYKFTLNSTDSNAGSYSTVVTLRVLAATGVAAIPTVAITAPSVITAGESGSILCEGSNNDGYAPTTAFQYQWVLTAPDGTSVYPLSSTSKSTSFTAPVAYGSSVVSDMLIECRVTDSAQKTGVTSKTVRILPPPSGSTVADAGISQTVEVGGVVRLDGSKSKAYSPQDAVAANARIYSRWSQSSGARVLLDSTNSLASSFIAPSFPTTNLDPLVFMLETAVDSEFSKGYSKSLVAVAVVPKVTTAITATVTPASQRVRPGDTVSIKVDAASAASTGTSSSAKTLYYSWTQVSGPSYVSIGGQSTSTMGFVAPQSVFNNQTTYVFRVSISSTPFSVGDPLALSLDSVVVVDPTPTVSSTVLDVSIAQALQTVNANATVNLVATTNARATDPNVYYLWQQISGPSVLIAGQTSRSASFTAPELASKSTLVFSVSVSYAPITAANPGLRSSDVVVVVNPVVTPTQTQLTVRTSQPSLAVKPGAVVGLNALTNATTADPQVYFLWTQTSGPAVALGGSSSSSAGFIAPVVTVPTTFTFSVEAAYQLGSASAVRATVVVVVSP